MTRCLLALLIFAVASPWVSAVEISLFQRGYVEGGTGAPTALTDSAVGAFEKLEPEIKIRVVGVPWGEDGDLKLRTALLAGGRVDLFRLANDQIAGFTPREGRLLSPIDGELTDEDRRDFGPTLDAVTVGGKAYAWPLWSTAISMIANTDLLNRAGVVPPLNRAMTWGEWTGALHRVTALRTDAGKPVYGFNAMSLPPLFEWAPLLMAHCGPLFTERDYASGSPLPLADGLGDAIARVRELVQSGLAAPGFLFDDDTGAQQSFLDGRVAFLLSSPGFLRKLQASGMHFAVLPPPIGDWGKPITNGAVGCFAVIDSRDPERIAAAHAFARYLTSAQIAADVPGWYLAPPARVSVTSFFEQPPYAALKAILPTAHYIVSPAGGGFMERIFVPKLDSAANGELTPDEAIAEIRAAQSRRALR